MTHQLVPPHDCRRNAAEKAIQILKNNFIALLCGTDETLSMQLWCALLPHAVVQLNMLRTSATKSEHLRLSISTGRTTTTPTPLQYWAAR